MHPTESHFIGGEWVSGGAEAFVSSEPATGEIHWRGRAAGESEIKAAVGAARGVYDVVGDSCHRAHSIGDSAG